ncbi:putative membrane protein [Escherichia albertii KF1]|nr:putative membrane protein [Escherichia albertii KF1]
MNKARVVNNLRAETSLPFFFVCHIVCYTSQLSFLLLHK